MAGSWGAWFSCTILFFVSGALNANKEGEGREAEGPCFSELGCFPRISPWYTVRRPFPIPLDPTEIDTNIFSYSRTRPGGIAITLWPNIILNKADVTSNRPTAFLTHGFSSSGNASWLIKLKDNYLKRLDANVFIIDWGKGATHMNYMQVASNTRVVGAEIIRFMEWLVKNYGLKLTEVHLLGHSLGAHICSYVAKRVPGIARITGFDPAQPGFETAGKAIRLDKSDAAFVEILHTNALPIIPLLGFGLMSPRGHVDFYINGGAHQPGCKTALGIMKELGSKVLRLKNAKEIFNQTVDDIIKWVGCSHGRSYIYYTEALDSPDCTFWGHKAGLVQRVINGATAGVSAPLFYSMEDCTEDTCLPLGLDAINYPARGAFSVVTNKEEPFCREDGNSSAVLKKLKTSASKTQLVLNDVATKAKSFAERAKSFGSSLKSKFVNMLENYSGKTLSSS